MLKPLDPSNFTMKIISDLGMLYSTKNSKVKTRFAMFECSSCKEEIKIAISNAKRETRTICKTCRSNKNKLIYFASKTRLYRIWFGIKKRCGSVKNTVYIYYGGRGISVCSEWGDNFINFREWALQNGYSDDLSIDRINNDGDYEPSNCRWATRATQARNTTKLSNRNTSGYRGVSKNHKKWAARISIDDTSVYLGSFDYPWTASYIYDSYVIMNQLEHTRNFD